MKTIKLYRGINKENQINHLDENIYLNYTDSIDFSKNYGDIIIEYELNTNLEIKSENIKDRYYDISKYDEKIENQCIEGYKWKISKKGIYYYRLNSKNLKIVQIHYLSNDLNTDISNITYINRKLL